MSLNAGFDAWRAHNPEGAFTDWLRAAHEQAWAAATGHRFVEELAQGTLADRHFRTYLIQDYAFIETLVTVVGFAVARAPDMPARKRWAGFLSVLTSEENDYFERAFAAIEVGPGEWRGASLSPVTARLREAMLAAAETGTYADILSVVVPAEWIYLTWATERSHLRPPQARYSEWIDLHAIPAFEEFVGWLRAQLDAAGSDLAPASQAGLAARFGEVVDLEIAFFEQAYEAHG